MDFKRKRVLILDITGKTHYSIKEKTKDILLLTDLLSKLYAKKRIIELVEEELGDNSVDVTLIMYDLEPIASGEDN